MSSWSEYCKAAVVGLERAKANTLSPDLEVAFGDLTRMSAEAAFLTRAGALGLRRKAGVKLHRGAPTGEPAEAESTRLVSEMSAGHLRSMLGGRCTGVLPEWLAAATAMGLHVPPELLPVMLDRVRQAREFRNEVLAVGGNRARWLAKQNPLWTFAEADLPETWETGNLQQRLRIFRSMRKEAPREARVKLGSIWDCEPAESRAAFATAMAEGLSPDDEAFLEEKLTDRSKEVRRAVIDLLARLQQSAFVSRMTVRALALVKQVPDSAGFAIEASLPEAPDAVAVRDGIDPKAFGVQSFLGDRGVMLVLILASTPLACWTELFSAAPEAITRAAEKSEFGRALVTGWTLAALRQRDGAWAAALMDAPLKPFAELLPGDLLPTLLPEAQRAERVAQRLREGILRKATGEGWHAIAGQLITFPSELPISLGVALLVAIRAATAEGIEWHLRPLAEEMLLRLPRELLPEAVNGWPVDRPGIAPLVELLAFRHDSIKALQNS